MQLREETEKLFGAKISDGMYADCLVKASKKLERIIRREGDLNGERRQQQYLARLVVEELQLARWTNYCFAKYEEERLKL